LNFSDPRSKLFFDYVRILNKLKKINPKVKFLLENVKMKKIYQDVISKELGVQPIQINSGLVSAQNRVRLYWTNIDGVTQPTDKNIRLKDIVEDNVDDKYFLSELAVNRLLRHNNNIIKESTLPDKSATIHAGYFKQGGRDQQYVDEVLCAASRGRYLVNGKRQDAKMKTAGLTSQRLELRTDGKTNCLTGVQKDNVLIVPEGTKKGYAEIQPNEGVDLTFPHSATRRGRRMADKSNCLTAAKNEYYWYNGKVIRRLTAVECERLQTVPDDYTSYVSDTQRYKMLGNGWTVDVVAHIFKNLL
jgi:DNA (cytosine-5)-methyltransferase 3A